jgi:hypothetical protein
MNPCHARPCQTKTGDHLRSEPNRNAAPLPLVQRHCLFCRYAALPSRDAAVALGDGLSSGGQNPLAIARIGIKSGSTASKS